jgi:hypothetical protein
LRKSKERLGIDIHRKVPVIHLEPVDRLEGAKGGIMDKDIERSKGLEDTFEETFMRVEVADIRLERGGFHAFGKEFGDGFLRSFFILKIIDRDIHAVIG